MNKWLQKKNIIERVNKQIAACYSFTTDEHKEMIEENINSLAKLLNKVYDMEFKESVVDYIYKFDIKEQEIITFRQLKNYESADKARFELIKWDWEKYERKDTIEIDLRDIK